MKSARIGARIATAGHGRSWLALLLSALLAAIGALGGGCEQDPEVVVDPALVAFLSKARSAHHRADLAERAGEPGTAIASVSSIIDGPRPTSTPEVVEVLSDALARRADLKSQSGDFDGGDADVDAGLALATAVTHFRGHLFEVRGLVAERRAESLAAAGAGQASDAARERAINAYEQAMDVQDEVIRAALEPAPPSR